jgi:F-type H+-transporting ATPase subunit delta
MMTAKQMEREAKRLFHSCLVDGKLDEERARRAIHRVLESKRRGYLSLVRRFERLLKLDYVRHTAKVECAVPLPPDLQASVRTGLEGKYGSQITTFFAKNPLLIGGMRIQVGSDVYDGSVLGGLDALRRSFGLTSTDGTR